MNELAIVTDNTPVVADDLINDYLKSLGNKLKDEDRQKFIQISKAFNLNPFIREIYGIPYGNNFNIIVGYEVYLKRAERSGTLEGWKAWTEGEGKALKGCVEITRKGWTRPFYHEVYLDEYDQGNSMWKSKPRTMIKKVAIAQGFRMAFPVELGGIPYTADEIGAEQKVADIVHLPGKKTLAEYAAEVDAIATVDELSAWYKANVKEYQKDLSPDDQKELLKVCADRKYLITEPCTDELFAELAKEWEPLVRSGKKKAKAIIAAAKTSMILTDEQQMQIAAWEEEGA